MPDAAWIDPYRNYNFKLLIQGVTSGHFTECSGLEIKVQSIPYREAGKSQVVHQLPGQVEYGAVSLRFGLTDSLELWEWFMKTVEGNVDRRNVTIVLLDSAGVEEKIRWDLENAWPAEWKGAPLAASNSEVAIESLKLVFETLKRG